MGRPSAADEGRWGARARVSERVGVFILLGVRKKRPRRGRRGRLHARAWDTRTSRTGWRGSSPRSPGRCLCTRRSTSRRALRRSSLPRRRREGSRSRRSAPPRNARAARRADASAPERASATRDASAKRANGARTIAAAGREAARARGGGGASAGFGDASAAWKNGTTACVVSRPRDAGERRTSPSFSRARARRRFFKRATLRRRSLIKTGHFAFDFRLIALCMERIGCSRGHGVGVDARGPAPSRAAALCLLPLHRSGLSL